MSKQKSASWNSASPGQLRSCTRFTLTLSFPNLRRTFPSDRITLTAFDDWYVSDSACNPAWGCRFPKCAFYIRFMRLCMICMCFICVFMLFYVVLCYFMCALCCFMIVSCCFILFYTWFMSHSCWLRDGLYSFMLFYIVLCCFMLFYVVLCCFIYVYVCPVWNDNMAHMTGMITVGTGCVRTAVASSMRSFMHTSWRAVWTGSCCFMLFYIRFMYVYVCSVWNDNMAHVTCMVTVGTAYVRTAAASSLRSFLHIIDAACNPAWGCCFTLWCNSYYIAMIFFLSFAEPKEYTCGR